MYNTSRHVPRTLTCLPVRGSWHDMLKERERNPDRMAELRSLQHIWIPDYRADMEPDIDPNIGYWITNIVS
jgi:hypothetical protein